MLFRVPPVSVCLCQSVSVSVHVYVYVSTCLWVPFVSGVSVQDSMDPLPYVCMCVYARTCVCAHYSDHREDDKNADAQLPLPSFILPYAPPSTNLDPRPSSLLPPSLHLPSLAPHSSLLPPCLHLPSFSLSLSPLR